MILTASNRPSEQSVVPLQALKAAAQEAAVTDRRAAHLGDLRLLRHCTARWRLQTEVTSAAVARLRQRGLCASGLSRWRRFAARRAWLRALLQSRAEGLAARWLAAWRAWARRRAELGRLLGAALGQRRCAVLCDALQHWKRMARFAHFAFDCCYLPLRVQVRWHLRLHQQTLS